jgi:hypothetical protein
MTQERREYDTGAVRSGDCEETRYDLISPIGLERLAQTYAEGAKKFGAFNWENGMPITDLLNHAIAHIFKYLRGDRSEDHLAHAAWNLLGAIHSGEMWPHLNDGTLRGAGCTCPPNAVVNNSSPETAIDIEPIGVHTYAVTISDPEKLEKLRAAILNKGE